jgi:hypothetical protein
MLPIHHHAGARQKFFAVLDEVRKLGQVVSRDINAQDAPRIMIWRLRLQTPRRHVPPAAILEKANTSRTHWRSNAS